MLGCLALGPQVVGGRADSMKSSCLHGRAFMFKIVVSTIVLLLTTGCASFIGEGKQTVSVQAVCYGRSMPSQCVAENGRGRTRFFAPGQVQVHRDFTALKVTCKSVFVDSHTLRVWPTVQQSMAGNVLLGGVVGAGVDVVTARGLQYPEALQVVFPSCNYAGMP